ncbi:hypothetical protein KKB55_11050 [Myxococcota bacterium]|nr:hypothetical protein [Myxococcota bacterium]MBU1898274.1 hypothetical protein [Myxococcota bacterium]
MTIKAAIEHLRGVIRALEPRSAAMIPFIEAATSRDLEGMQGAQDRRFTLTPETPPRDNAESGSMTLRAGLILRVIYRDNDEALLWAAEDAEILAYALGDPAHFGRPGTTILNIEPVEAEVIRLDDGRRGLLMNIRFDLIYLQDQTS